MSGTKMTDEEIRKRLLEFCDEIMDSVHSKEEAIELEKRLNAFCAENHVTFEQEQVITEHGAGEVLHMLTSAPTDEEWYAMQEQRGKRQPEKGFGLNGLTEDMRPRRNESEDC